MDKNQKFLNLNKDFGKRFRLAREQVGISQTDLAEKLGYKTSGSISNIESGKSLPTIEALKGIAEISNIDLHWLITGENFNPQKRIQAQFTETYSILVNECQEAQDAIQRLEAKKQSGQPLTAAEERELLTCRGIERTAIKQMENAMQAASKELNTPGSDNNK